jgi:hypothetical protein
MCGINLMNDKKDNLWERLPGYVFILMVLGSLIYLINDPPPLSDFTLPVVRLLAALAVGYSGYLITGYLKIGGRIPGIPVHIPIKAGGTFALFLLVFFMFPLGDTPVPPGFDKIQIAQEIENPLGNHQGDPIVSIANGNVPIVRVKVENIPRNLNTDKWKVVVFAREYTNPNWDCQGEVLLSDSSPRFPLKLWNSEQADKRYYSAISTISPGNIDDYCRQAYSQADIRRIAKKQSAQLRFYRDDKAISQ